MLFNIPYFFIITINKACNICNINRAFSRVSSKKQQKKNNEVTDFKFLHRAQKHCPKDYRGSKGSLPLALGEPPEALTQKAL
jgi:hypothetical protein